jgi:hypothetical protein
MMHASTSSIGTPRRGFDRGEDHNSHEDPEYAIEDFGLDYGDRDDGENGENEKEDAIEPF